MSNLRFVLDATLVISALVVAAMLLGRWIGRRFDAPIPWDDRIVRMDTWTEEKRRGLARLNHPAPKGFKAPAGLAYRDRQVH